MGRRGSHKRATSHTAGPPPASISLREESSGKKHANVSAKSMLKLDHIKNLAVWATSEASLPSLGAFFGHRLAASSEAIGVPTDPSLLTCQRCETILQPGYNCTVRIEKNRGKVKHRRKKSINAAKNDVAITCHFCSHRNLKRGTPRCHMKTICPPKVKSSAKLSSSNSKVHKAVSAEEIKTSNVDIGKVDEVVSQAMAIDDGIASSPATPLVRSSSSLLEGKKRKRNKSGGKRVAESESNSATTDTEKAVCASSKRKRKSWTSLKEIVESGEHDASRNIPNLAVPFLI